MNQTMIDGATGAVELLDGILYLRWASGAVIEEQDARAAMAALHRAGQGHAYPVLIEMTTTAWLSCRARKVFSGPCQATRIALLGSSPVDRIIASFFLSRYSQPYTARFFTSLQEALVWLADPAHCGSEMVPEGTPDGTKTG